MQAAFYLIDLLQDSNTEVVKAADRALTVISETNEEWATKLRALKFEAHNQVWLEACANGIIQQVSQYGAPSISCHACMHPRGHKHASGHADSKKLLVSLVHLGVPCLCCQQRSLHVCICNSNCCYIHALQNLWFVTLGLRTTSAAVWLQQRCQLLHLVHEAYCGSSAHDVAIQCPVMTQLQAVKNTMHWQSALGNNE